MKKLQYPFLTLAFLAPLAFSEGTEMLGTPLIDINADATDVIVAGIGFSEGQPDSVTFDVPAGATVLQVLAYWEGFALAEDEQGANDTIQIDFGPGFVNVIGDRIGGPSEFIQPQSYWTSTYRAELDPALVASGTNTWPVQGLDFGFVNNGLGVVLLVDNSESTSVQIQDGNDAAFINFASPFDTTTEVVFDYDPVDEDRAGAISHIVNSVTSTSSIGPDRPTIIRVAFDDAAPTIMEVDLLGENAATPPGGFHFWDGDIDVLRHLITVPANSSRVRIQIFSEDSGVGPFAGRLPASLVWLTTAFTLEQPVPPAELGDTVYCDENDNGMQDPGEPGIPGAIVNLTCAGPDGVLDTADDILDSMMTDANGNYLFTGLEPGLCRAVVDPTSVVDKVPGMCPPSFTEDLEPGESFLDADFCFVTPPAELGDTVYCDLNDNGVQDPGEPGIAGAIVNLTCAGPDGMLDTADDLVDSQMTDANGNYLFTELPPGLCRAAVDVDSVDDKEPGMCPLTFTEDLAPGESFLDADFCFVEPPGGGQGCTPGFWKNRGLRTGQWELAGYAPGMNFDMVFGTSVFGDSTMIQVIRNRPTVEVPHDLYKALGRHAVAGLLNAASPNVDYDMTPEAVITAVNMAFASGDLDVIESTKDMLDAFNNQGSPICR